MSKKNNIQFFTTRCPKCRKKITLGIHQSLVLQGSKEGENIECECKNCSHRFILQYEVKVISRNKKAEKENVSA